MCFLAYLWSCLIGIKDVKSIKGIESSFIRDISIDGILIEAVSK